MEFENLLFSFQNDTLDVRRYIPDKFAKFAELRSIPYLGAALLDPEIELVVRIECAEALGKLGDDRAIPFLIDALEGENEELKRTIVWSLGQIGTPSTLTPITSMIFNSSPRVQRWAIKSLRRVRADVEMTFISIFTYYNDFDINAKYEIFRTVTEQISRISDPNPWYILAREELQVTSDPIMHKATLQLLKYNFDVMNADIDFLKKIVVNNPNASHISDILLILSKLGEQAFIKSLLNNNNSFQLQSAIFSSLSYDTYYLQENLGVYTLSVLDSFAKNPDLLTIDISPYLKSDDLSIYQAALRIHVLQDGEYSALKKAIIKGKGLGKIIPLLGFYEEGSDLLMEYAINGKKNERIPAVRTIIKKLGESDKIRELLELVIRKERVWHLRRDARIALE